MSPNVDSSLSRKPSSSKDPEIAMEKVASNRGEAASSEIYINPVIHGRILRKLDMRLGPLFCLLFLSCYLDRTNIGNAAVAGLNTQLGLSGSQYSTAVSVFFATYVAFMVPFGLLFRKLKPHRTIAILAGAWSIVTIGTAFVRSYSSLLAVRLILGFCESGFFPCISLYLTMVYNREEQGLRFAYVFAATAISGMFGGLIATGITHISTDNGVQPWSWLYIIEGLVSLIGVPWAWYGLPAYPAHANWWTPEERATMEARELKRREYMGAEKFEWEQVRSALKEWRVYTGALIQFFQDIMLYGFSTFLPSILHNGLGYTPLQAQYLSVPVYLLGGISFFTAAKIGDKWGLRGTCLLVLDVFAVAGYAILIGVESDGARYFACYLIALPLYCGPGLNELWIVNNTAPHYRRATAQGISQAVGNLAGLVAPQVYRSAPYLLGHWASLVSVLISMALISVQIVHYRIQNRKKDQIMSGEREDDRKGTVGEDNLGFRYVY